MKRPKRPRQRAILGAGALIALMTLAGCLGDEGEDVRSEMAAISKDLRGRVDPLPQNRERTVLPLEFGRDPFARK